LGQNVATRGRNHEPRPRAGADRRLVTENPPVRFDEGKVETEHGKRLLRYRRGNPETDYIEAYHTAPPLDCTLLVPVSWVLGKLGLDAPAVMGNPFTSPHFPPP
jgi:hypothetical protein